MENLIGLTVLSCLLRILLAFACGGLIGFNRQQNGNMAGLRTHMVICLGGALTSICSLYASQFLGLSTDVMRLSAQVISGIGFIGVGTILVSKGKAVTGLTTAAGVWTTGIIGIVIGFGGYIVAIVSTVCLFFLFVVVKKAEPRIFHITKSGFYIEVDDVRKVQEIEGRIKSSYKVLKFEVTPPSSGCSSNVGLFVIINTNEMDINEVKAGLLELNKHIVFVLENN